VPPGPALVALEATLVIDASLNKRIATELKARGRMVVAASELKLHRVKDPPLLRALSEHFGDDLWVLVTADDAMPAEHGELIVAVGATLATIDPRRPAHFSDDDAWGREVAHRWAHTMAMQPAGSIRRYGESGGRTWTHRRH